MMRLINILTIITVLGLFVIGCENNSSPVEQQSASTIGLPGTAKIIIPDGATLESATFYAYATVASNKTVDFYRVTSDWDEYTVTFNSFGSTYAPTSYGTFVAANIGWTSVDLTTLVQEWLDGTDNFGFVMMQNEEMSPYSKYNSRENAENNPYLEVCYSTAAGVVCETSLPIADAYIWEFYANTNNGMSDALFTGWYASTKKQSLVKFEFEESEPELAELGDRVWIDDNFNGIQDDSEVGYSGGTVNLYNCQGEFMATTTTDENGFYLFTDLMPGDYYVEFEKPAGFEFTMQDIGDDAMDSDADLNTGITICTTLGAGESNKTLDAGLYIPESDCGDCDGKITELTFKYLGDTSAEVTIYTKKDHTTLFSGMVDPDGIFTFIGDDKHGTMGTEIEVYIDNGLNVKIHTSCSQPLEIGMVFGDFEVIDGYSRNGGKICVYNGPGGDPEDPDCGDCDGKITELTFKYLGDTSAEVTIYTKKDHMVLFSGMVDPDETFNFVGNDKKGTMGTEIEVYVENEMNVKIHTSCSQPLEIGMVFGDFEVIDGYSRNGGQICSYDGDYEDTSSYNDDDCDDKGPKHKHHKKKKHHKKHKK